MLLVVSGVAGSGKSTIGKMLAERLNVPYAEADDFHSEANRLRMAAGLPLSDDDREPWLAAICDWIAQRLVAGKSGVVTCSALKRSYRDQLITPGVKLIFLKVDWETITSRLDERHGHFFPAALAQSQFDTLEEPQPGEDVLVVDASATPEKVVSQILDAVEVPSKP
jgi:gluconokinase